MTAQIRLLEVEGLRTRFYTRRGVIGAVEGVSIAVYPGEAIGVVGESGSGKSVTALSILRLVPLPGRIESGRIMLNATDLLQLPERAMREIRRKQIAMIFQDPSNFLNPVLPIGEQIAEGIDERDTRKEGINNKVVEALRSVGIPEPRRVAAYYPFQMSGGMQQRAVIAAAIVRRPSLIIADEPTTALDATVQYQILRLLTDLQSSTGTALVLISHDLAVVASVCSRVYVMYAAQVVESGTTASIYHSPAHPYTQALLGSILDPLEKKQSLVVLAGSIPDLADPPGGCRFHPRCPRAMPVCSSREPPMFFAAGEQIAKCWLFESKPEVRP